MDTMDHSPFSIWSIDEPGLEEINSAGIDQYDSNGGRDVVEEMNPYPLKGNLGLIFLSWINIT